MMVLVCGDRKWGNYRCDRCAKIVWPCPCCIERNKSYEDAMVREFKNFNISCDKDVVIEGDAAGADKMAGRIATKLGFARGHNLQVYPADWPRYGRAAGSIRNQVMLDKLLAAKRDGVEVLVLAFHPDIERSKGTKDMVTRSRAAGVRAEVFPC